MPDLIPVRVRDCACPDTPHADEGDLVYLLPRLPLDGGITAEQQLREFNGDASAMLRAWTDTFVRFGAKGWNLLDADGDPVPFDVDVIIADWAVARPVADKASDLYSESVMAPFRKPPQTRSPTGRTGPTTSRRRRQTR